MNKLLDAIEKYGLLFILLNSFYLLPPDLTSKLSLMELNMDLLNASQAGSSLKKQLTWLLPFILYFLSFIRLENFLLKEIYKHRLVAILLLVVVVLMLSFMMHGNALMLKRIVFQTILIFVVFSSVYFSLRSRTTAKCINYLVIVMIVVSFISIILGTGYVGAGFSAWAKTKNTFGSYLLAALLLLWYAKNYLIGGIRFYKFKVAFLIIFLVMSASKTSLALACIVMFFDIFKFTLNLKILAVSILALSSVFILLPGIFSILGVEWHIALYMEPETLTGRGTIWDALYYDLLLYDKLWIGYGYASYFGTGITPYVLDDSYSFIRNVTSAHNGYLELVLQLGVTLSGVVIYLIYKMVAVSRDSGVYLAALIIFLHNITESSFLKDQQIMWIVLLVMICIGGLNNLKRNKK